MMNQPIEPETYTFFDGAGWWVTEIFVHNGDRYAHLLREPSAEDPRYRTHYGKLSYDGCHLYAITPFDWQNVAKAWATRKAADILARGEEAIPRVGRYSDMASSDDPDNAYGPEENY